MIVDNLALNFSKQPENGYLIKDFVGHKNDKELESLEMFLNQIITDNCIDIRRYLAVKD